MNLFYVRLNKCVLFNNKQNGMASIKMKVQVHTVQHSTFKINKFLKCKQTDYRNICQRQFSN